MIHKAFNSNPVRNGVKPLIESQLDNHIDGKEDPIGYTGSNGEFKTTYSALTEKISGGRKKQGDAFDLNDTGAFRGSIRFEEHEMGFEIGANVLKPEGVNLLNKFGEDILELTNKNKAILGKTMLLPEIQKIIRRELL